MGRILRLWVVACACITAAAPAFAQQPSPAGRIKVVSGEAVIVRGNSTLPAQNGLPVYQSDSLRTGTDGRIGVTLSDDTQVSIGPRSEVRLDSFVYDPGQGQLGLVLKFIRGTAAYVSGQIAKLAPDAVRLETPAAIVGVRGTTLGMEVTSD
ncbi:MAG TPA: FecR domain-containing protein [Vicinamibacterales bacterium]|jgi:hypothetical protein|nr:FecR domain-containing protein [Vicinamibacterales bacterium]